MKIQFIVKLFNILIYTQIKIFYYTFYLFFNGGRCMLATERMCRSGDTVKELVLPFQCGRSHISRCHTQMARLGNTLNLLPAHYRKARNIFVHVYR